MSIKTIKENIAVYIESKSNGKVFHIGQTEEITKLKKYEDINGESHFEGESKIKEDIKWPENYNPEHLASLMKENNNFNIYFVYGGWKHIKKAEGMLENYFPNSTSISRYSSPEILNDVEVSDFKRKVKETIDSK